ncbi:MAG: hemolysin family protein [Gemmatimonadota bacterium]
MTPRTDIVAVPVDADLDEILGVAGESGFSRLPVYGESIDDIRGVVLVKDLLPWLRREDRDQLDVEEVSRSAIFVPDTKPVDDLLAKMRMEKVHMAVVVDEFGGTDGIVTLEDLVEEIVGDIYDEHDTAEPEVVVREDGEVELDGGVSLSDLQERFELPREAHQEEYDTVAGYVIGQLGRIPESGEEVPLGPASLEVTEITERRVTGLQLHLPPEKQVEPGEEAPQSEDADAPDEPELGDTPGAAANRGNPNS